jgi:integrase/recombinase XerC
MDVGPHLEIPTMSTGLATLPEMTSTTSTLRLFQAPFRLVDASVASKAESTRRTYAECFASWAKYLALEDPDPETALQCLISQSPGNANALVLSYQEWLLKQGMAPGTVNLRLAALRSSVKTARRLGLTSLYLECPGVPCESYRDTRGVGAEMIATTLRTLASKQGGKSIRDYAIVRLMASCGLRRAEVCSLDVEHLDCDQGRLMVLGKGKRQRLAMTVPAPTLDALRRWIAVRGSHPGPMFTSLDRAKKGDGRLTGRSLWSITTKLGLRNPHSIRHSSITSGLDLTGGNVRAVRMHSRHASIDIVCRYDDRRTDMGGDVAKLIDAALDVH